MIFIGLAIGLPWVAGLVIAAVELIDHDRIALHPAHALLPTAWLGSLVLLVAAAVLAVGGSPLWTVGIGLHHLGLAVAGGCAVTGLGLQVARLLRPNAPIRFDPGGLVAVLLVAVAHGVGLRFLLGVNVDWDLAPWVGGPLLLAWAASGCLRGGERVEVALLHGRRLMAVGLLALWTSVFLRWLALETELPLVWALLSAVAVAVAPPRAFGRGELATIVALAPLLAWLGWVQLEPVPRAVPQVPEAPFLERAIPTWPFVCEEQYWTFGARGWPYAGSCQGRSATGRMLIAAAPVLDLSIGSEDGSWLAVNRGRSRALVVSGRPSHMRSLFPDGVFVRPLTYTRFRTDDGEIGLSELSERARGKPLVFDTAPGWTVEDWLQVCAHVGASQCHLQNTR